MATAATDEDVRRLLAVIASLETRIRLLERENVVTAHVNVREATAPAVTPADTCTIFAVDNGSGKTVLKAQFSSGAAQTIATQP